MAYNDIKAWRDIMNAEELEKDAYDKAVAAATARAEMAKQLEFDELDQVQVDPDTLEIEKADEPVGCVCLDDLDDDDIDFSAYGVSEADLGVYPADETYPTGKDLSREPLVRLPAAIGRPASDADLVSQNVVRLMMEVAKRLQGEKDRAEVLDEDYEFEESDGEINEDDQIEKVNDQLDQIQQNDDYPLSDSDWTEINSQPTVELKIQTLQGKVQDRWPSLSAQAKRQIRDDVMEMRKELIKSRYGEMQFKEALRLQKISRKRELTDKEKEKFSSIVRFVLDDTQKAALEKNLYANGFEIPRQGVTTHVPASDAQSGNVKDHHGGEDSVERQNETGLDQEFDISKFTYQPEPMKPGTEIPADFDPNYGPDQTQPNKNAQDEVNRIAKQLKPGHEQRKKDWTRREMADRLGDDFYTDNPKVWKEIVGSLEPDEIGEITDELLNELPGERADNKRMLDYMFGGMNLLQRDMAAQSGYGGDQSGRTGGLTQQGDKLVNVMMIALATYLNIAGEHLPEFTRNLRSENTGPREVRKRLRPLIFREICDELGVNPAQIGRSAGVVPSYDGGLKAKRAADRLIMTLFVREYDQMSAQDREQVNQILRNYESGSKTVKLKTGLTPDQNSEFQGLIIRMREEGDLPDVDRIRLMQLDALRKNPGIGEEQARRDAEQTYNRMTRNGDDEFIDYTTKLAKTFVRGTSHNVTRDTITNPDRTADGE